MKSKKKTKKSKTKAKTTKKGTKKTKLGQNLKAVLEDVLEQERATQNKALDELTKETEKLGLYDSEFKNDQDKVSDEFQQKVTKSCEYNNMSIFGKIFAKFAEFFK